MFCKGAPGVEPGTSRSAVECSTTELYPPCVNGAVKIILQVRGVNAWQPVLSLWKRYLPYRGMPRKIIFVFLLVEWLIQ